MRRALLIAATLVCTILISVSAYGQVPPGYLRMALVDTKSLYVADNIASLQTNIDNIKTWVDRAAAQGAEFIGFPELGMNGYKFTTNANFWLSLNGSQVQQIKDKAVQKGVYISVGLAELDAQNNKWNTQIVINPSGSIIGWHHKNWLTSEAGYTQTGTDHNVFDVKGARMGISTCADGSDYANLKGLVDNGATLIYGPHANTTGGTIQGWYNFRAKWGGTYTGSWALADSTNYGPQTSQPTGGWIDYLTSYAGRDIQAALHNHARYYSPYQTGEASLNSWAAGAWFIGPHGATTPNNAQTQVYGFATTALTPNPTGLTVAQEPTSLPVNAAGFNTYEYMLICNVLVPEPGTLGLLAIGAMMLLRRRG